MVDSQSFRLKIPAWMLSPAAACFSVSPQATIGASALLALVELLSTNTDGLDGDGGSDGHDGGADRLVDSDQGDCTPKPTAGTLSAGNADLGTEGEHGSTAAVSSRRKSDNPL